MHAFIAASWPSSNPQAADAAARLAAHLVGGDWGPAANEAGFGLWVVGDPPPAVLREPYGGGWVVGDVVSMSGAMERPDWDVQAEIATDALGAATRLSARVWGAYAALWPDAASGALQVFREPMGACEALVWSRGFLRIVASNLSAPGVSDLLPDLALSWDRVGDMLRDPRLIGGDLGLGGIEAVSAGELRRFGIRDERLRVWTPADVVMDPAQVGADGDGRELAHLLEATVDRCVRALARLSSRPVLAEVSGGLDSAIVATALRRAKAPVAAWLNYATPEVEGDERIYARQVAERLGVTLTEAELPGAAFDLAALETWSDGPRPCIGAIDAAYDGDVATRMRDAGAWAAFTGQGGDTVFFAMPASALAADLKGWSGRLLADPRLRALAQRGRTSVWSMLAQRRAARGLRREPATPFPGLSARLTSRPPPDPHPWLAGSEGLAPSKRMQLSILTHNLLSWGDCARAREGRLFHVPLLQPVMELALRIPALTLTEGGKDRALARRAFASRLPEAVITRAGKGDLTGHYGRRLAAALPDLRPYLLGGRLIEQGLLDLSALDPLLTVESLARRGGYSELLGLAAVEAWARRFSSRPSPGSDPLA